MYFWEADILVKEWACIVLFRMQEKIYFERVIFLLRRAVTCVQCQLIVVSLANIMWFSFHLLTSLLNRFTV